MPIYRTYNCLDCGKLNEHKPNTKEKYCNLSCMHSHHKKVFIEKWLNGTIDPIKTYSGVNNTTSTHIRKYLFEECAKKCVKCGWGELNQKTGLVPLQINHIDGDSTNNLRKNLEVLCPNCHSLTDTFGRHGRGRNKRYAGIA